EPILNVEDLKEIHSEITVRVPEPVLFTNSHHGLDLQNAKKRKLDDGADDENCRDAKAPEHMMRCNARLVDLIERVKPEIRTLI
ncbi:hypothetical protein CRUP_008363, partial [Coryphaenoides rupestris]